MLIGGETNRHFLPCFPLFHTFLPLCVICDAPAVCLSKLTNCLSTNPSIQLSINRQSTVALHPSCAAQAALRVFVPSSMPVGTLPAVAFQAFRALPDGLAKVRTQRVQHALLRGEKGRCHLVHPRATFGTASRRRCPARSAAPARAHSRRTASPPPRPASRRSRQALPASAPALPAPSAPGAPPSAAPSATRCS